MGDKPIFYCLKTAENIGFQSSRNHIKKSVHFIQSQLQSAHADASFQV